MTASVPAVETAVRRQPRGQRRMVEILDAAAVVFGRLGVERATTNAIATQAGISPGSLYQFFRDKDDIVAALATRFAADLERAHDDAFAGFDAATAPTREAVDRMLDPIIGFKRANTAFVTVFSRTDLPEAMTHPVGQVEEVFAARLAEVLRARNPDVPAADVATAVQTVIALTQGALNGPEVAQVEVKLAILGYFDRKGLR